MTHAWSVMNLATHHSSCSATAVSSFAMSSAPASTRCQHVALGTVKAASRIQRSLRRRPAGAPTLAGLQRGLTDAAACLDITELQTNGSECGRAYGTVYNGTSTSRSKTRISQRTSLRSFDERHRSGSDASSLPVKWVLVPGFALLPTTSIRVAEVRTDPLDQRTDRFIASRPRHPETLSHKRRSALGTSSRRRGTSSLRWMMHQRHLRAPLAADEDASESLPIHRLLVLSLLNSSQSAS